MIVFMTIVTIYSEGGGDKRKEKYCLLVHSFLTSAITIMIAVMDVTMTTYVTTSVMNIDSVMLIMRIMMKMHIFDDGEHPVFVSLC